MVIPFRRGLYNRKFPQEKDWYFQEAIEMHIVICIPVINIHEKQDTDVVSVYEVAIGIIGLMIAIRVYGLENVQNFLEDIIIFK